jgi:hypothetical protein
MIISELHVILLKTNNYKHMKHRCRELIVLTKSAQKEMYELTSKDMAKGSYLKAEAGILANC